MLLFRRVIGSNLQQMAVPSFGSIRGENGMNKRNLNEAVHLSDEQKKALAEKIRAFYAYIREEEIGIIEEQQIIELFCEHMAPIVYNKALDDAMRWFKDRLENIESDYYLLYRDVR